MLKKAAFGYCISIFGVKRTSSDELATNSRLHLSKCCNHWRAEVTWLAEQAKITSDTGNDDAMVEPRVVGFVSKAIKSRTARGALSIVRRCYRLQ